MIEAVELYDTLQRKPFSPLRVYLKDGRCYDIRYPWNNVVGTNYVVIGIPTLDDPEIAERTIKVPLELIDRVEPLAETSPSFPA